MADFTLEPDAIEPARPERRTPPRQVATGVAPTSDVPPVRGKAKDAPPCYAPCLLCGQPVLTGATPARPHAAPGRGGSVLCGDVGQRGSSPDVAPKSGISSASVCGTSAAKELR